MDTWPDLNVRDLISPRDEGVVLSFKATATITKGDPRIPSRSRYHSTSYSFDELYRNSIGEYL